MAKIQLSLTIYLFFTLRSSNIKVVGNTSDKGKVSLLLLLLVRNR